MTEPQDLYQEILLQHSRQPHHRGTLPSPSHQAEEVNPLCGDRVSLSLLVKTGILREIRFEGEGCILSQASASMLTEACRGLDRAQIQTLGARFEALVRGNPAPNQADLGELSAFHHVRDFPTRARCALLAWRALDQALKDQENL
jgi:nitrogen fixation NifU-like protein